MSHYSVGVIIKKEDIEREFEEGKELINDKEFIDNASEEERSVLEFNFIQRYVDKALQPFNENLEVEPYISTSMEEVQNKFEKIRSYEGDDEYYLRMRNIYKNATLDDFIKDYYCQDYTEEGLLSTYNPDSKWDWYVIGGRWNGCLPIKGVNRDEEDPISTYIEDPYSYAQIKNIAFTIELTETQIKEYTEKYNTLTTKGDFFKPEYYQEKYPTLDAYLNEQKSFSTYALLTSDGEWHEPGEMGWFGMSSASPKDEVNFKNTYKELIEQQDPEDYFVLVDCHI